MFLIGDAFLRELPDNILVSGPGMKVWPATRVKSQALGIRVRPLWAQFLFLSRCRTKFLFSFPHSFLPKVQGTVLQVFKKLFDALPAMGMGRKGRLLSFFQAIYIHLYTLYLHVCLLCFAKLAWSPHTLASKCLFLGLWPAGCVAGCVVVCNFCVGITSLVTAIIFFPLSSFSFLFFYCWSQDLSLQF